MTKSQTSAASDVKQYFTGLASAYADFRPTYPEDAIQWIIKGLPMPLSAADIGCGTGYHARRMAPRVLPRGRVYGVDIQPEMLQLLTNNMAEAAVTNVVPVLGTIKDPKLPAASVD